MGSLVQIRVTLRNLICQHLGEHGLMSNNELSRVSKLWEKYSPTQIVITND